ncbi:MAG: hypothetical protein P4L53_17570 [Candidatus Obscuribacterales bacterium]|nr:hypothetical protein [Candidatus Obscuribacterales bacterium]
MKYPQEIAIAFIASVLIAGGAGAQDIPAFAPAQVATFASPSITAGSASSVSDTLAPTSQSTLLRGNAMKKFDAGKHLSSEEYRSLEAGCVGFESHHVFFEDLSTITIVYRDSPAYRAGIRAGDQIVAPEEVEDAKFEADPTISRLKIKCGRAGTPVDVTVLRDGQPVKLTLLRMNIEDIQEPEYRHSWEKVLRQLGYPQDGDFSGTSLKDLTPTQ